MIKHLLTVSLCIKSSSNIETVICMPLVFFTLNKGYFIISKKKNSRKTTYLGLYARIHSEKCEKHSGHKLYHPRGVAITVLMRRTFSFSNMFLF